MSAQDNLSPEQFFHGTRHTLKPGQLLEGGKVLSNQGFGTPGDHVYFSTDPHVAGEFAGYAHGPGHKPAVPHVYEVEPIGKPERDPGEDESAGSYRSRQARVVRSMPRVQWIAGFQNSGEAWKA